VDAVTFLQSQGPFLAKTVCAKDGGAVEVVPYDNAKKFSAEIEPVGSLDDLARAIAKRVGNPRTAMVLGEINRGTDADDMVRTLYPRADTPATLSAVPRSWLPIDLDDLEVPEGADIAEPQVCLEAALKGLPAECLGVTVIVQFTGSHGFKPGIRLRLFYWLARPLLPRQMLAWLKPYAVDAALYNANQLIYTAAPILMGVENPFPDGRLFLLRGEKEVLEVPDASTIEYTTKPGVSYDYVAPTIGYRTLREHIGPKGFFEPIKAAAASYIGSHRGRSDLNWLEADLAAAIIEHAHLRPAEYIQERLRDLPRLIQVLYRWQRSADAERQRMGRVLRRKLNWKL